jgi:signal transduction histidine kinase
MRPIPFSIVAPATIVFFGAGVAYFTIALGLNELRTHADDAVRHEAQALAATFAPRLAASPREEWPDLLNQAADSCACTLMIQTGPNTIKLAAPSQPLSSAQLANVLATTTEVIEGDDPYFVGRTQLKLARDRESETNTEQLHLISLMAPLDVTPQQGALVSSVATFAILLLVLAGSVGWTLARDVHSDVLFVRDRIAAMAKESEAPEARAIPVRTIDQVGQLTASFNVLLQRFRAAERAYRQDLVQARSFDQDRTAFLSALSHELRTPLNAILGFADVLLHEIDGELSEDARENLSIVRASGEHLRSLIDDILALSALESGEFRLSRESLDVYQVAQDVVTEARLGASQKGIAVALHAASGPTVASADRRRVRQILGNVVGNAVKFTSTGQVTVELSGDDEWITIAVKDTGPGIPDEQLDAIFEEFQQADSHAARRMGTGLGLSITRRLTQMHGGTVRVASQVGKGSVFTIRLPVTEPQAPTSNSNIVPRASHPVILEG